MCLSGQNCDHQKPLPLIAQNQQPSKGKWINIQAPEYIDYSINLPLKLAKETEVSKYVCMLTFALMKRSSNMLADFKSRCMTGGTA